MKKMLLLLSVIVLTGCDLFKDSSATAGLFRKPAENIIKFRENTIKLPKGYVKIETDQFRLALDTLQNKPILRNFALSELKNLEEKKTDFQIFAQTSNIENYVFVYACDFFTFDEQRAAQHVDILNKKRKAESKKEKIRYQRIHGRYFYTSNSKIIKLKYVRAYKKEKQFQTEYIVASKTGGIGLLVSNIENIDFEDSVKNSLVVNY
ncbi:hypothetical protein NBT05_05880 [Aquimarina sp. ERC-38]|uniref:hypothetical protein n=1 Tax=Aquimarina sp. ERC-38 TaxID=2949996 RepID=UPI00224795C1|nr:hypothetical protein [Aquimarina sp. ERC-38]UZO81995.1 hypothetical protein NBT05_05880 [Aquimarina sp. ERC-38]